MQITHCPECATAFKVTPEQMRLAQGWVRCGRCGAVFEAAKYLQAPEAQGAAVLTQDEPQTLASPQPLAAPSPKVKAAEPQVVVPAPEIKPPARLINPGEPSLNDEWLLSSRAQAHVDAVEHDGASDSPKRGHNGLSAFMAFVLLLLLIWQGMVYKRDWLLAHEPGMRGLLTVLCAPVGCTPQWPQMPESLQIDSSSFTRDPQDFYSVQLRIKNTEPFPLATPHLELSLLDVYDDVILRRVFSPEEMKLGDAITALRDVRVAMSFDLSEPVAQKVTGYRVFLFYP